MSIDKIYSRPRIKISKNLFHKNWPNGSKTNQNNKRVNSKKFKIIVILLIAIGTAKVILDAVYPIFDTLCESKAKSIATIISNEEATNVMKKYSYDDLFTVEKDSNNNISMIKSNVIIINEISSLVAEKIQKRLDNTERENLEIALR